MKKITLYYDNFCPNCKRFSKLIKKIDWFDRIIIRELRNPEHISQILGIDLDLAEKEIASYDGNWAYGFESLLKIFRKLPLLWGFLPFLYLFHYFGMGNYLYRKIANNRTIISLHCSEETCQPSHLSIKKIGEN